MKIWIDKQGGRHYHKEDCPMVKEPVYHYEPIEVGEETAQIMAKGIYISGKTYMPCPGCFSEIFTNRAGLEQ